MPTLVLTFPGLIMCAECGYYMRQVSLSEDKRVATIECGTMFGGKYVGNARQPCKNYLKKVQLRALEVVCEDA